MTVPNTPTAPTFRQVSVKVPSEPGTYTFCTFVDSTWWVLGRLSRFASRVSGRASGFRACVQSRGPGWGAVEESRRGGRGHHAGEVRGLPRAAAPPPPLKRPFPLPHPRPDSAIFAGSSVSPSGFGNQGNQRCRSFLVSANKTTNIGVSRSPPSQMPLGGPYVQGNIRTVETEPMLPQAGQDFVAYVKARRARLGGLLGATLRRGFGPGVWRGSWRASPGTQPCRRQLPAGFEPRPRPGN
jgi:hypothetical protein